MYTKCIFVYTIRRGELLNKRDVLTPPGLEPGTNGTLAGTLLAMSYALPAEPSWRR